MGQPVTQFQVIAKDPDQAAEFYGTLFGWTIDANNAMGYRVVHTGSESGIHGGIWTRSGAGTVRGLGHGCRFWRARWVFGRDNLDEPIGTALRNQT